MTRLVTLRHWIRRYVATHRSAIRQAVEAITIVQALAQLATLLHRGL